MQPLVSAVITTYERDEVVLRRAIDSVLKQNYSNIEVIVIDDNGDESHFSTIVKEVVSSYAKDNVFLYPNMVNQGVQKSRNKGISLSKGEFIGLLDDDDEWLPDKVEKQIRLFYGKENENVGLVYSWYNKIKKNGNFKSSIELVKTPIYKKNDIIKQLFRGNYIGSNSFPLMRKQAIIKVGGYDESLLASQDLDLWIRLAKKYDFRCVEEPLVNYYDHEGERISSNFALKEKAEKDFFAKYENDIKSDSLALALVMKNLGDFSAYQGKIEKARSYYKKSIRSSRTDISFHLWVFKKYFYTFFTKYKQKL